MFTHKKRFLSFCQMLQVSVCLLAHRWPVRLEWGWGGEGWFKWISITENCLARINHNKNGTCGLSSLKDRLPWDTCWNLSHHMPHWSRDDRKEHGEDFRARGKDFQWRLKYSSLFKRLPLLPSVVYSLPDAACHRCCCFKDDAFTCGCYFLPYCCGRDIWISLINHPCHTGTVSYAGRFKWLFYDWSQPTDMSAVVEEQNKGVCPAETLSN